MSIFDVFRKKENNYGNCMGARMSNREVNYQKEIDNYDYSLEPFRMTIEDIFSITGRGVVVVGYISSGEVNVGDTVRLYRNNMAIDNVIVGGIEVFRKQLDKGRKGQNVGILLKGLNKNDFIVGDVLGK